MQPTTLRLHYNRLQLYYKGALKYYISAEGGEGGLTSIAYVAYTFRGVGGVPEQNAYVILEPIRTS